MGIMKQVFLTKAVKTPNNDIIHALKTGSEKRMLLLEQPPSYIGINNNLYTSAVTVNMHLNCARERKLKI